jgi:hypothetical protein
MAAVPPATAIACSHGNRQRESFLLPIDAMIDATKHNGKRVVSRMGSLDGA